MTEPIEIYFSGEKLEMLAILFGCLFATVVTTMFWYHDRGQFSRGLLTSVALSSLLLCSTAVGLLVRDGSMRSSLIEQVGRGEADSVFAAEKARIGIVIAKYPMYRKAAVLLGLLSVIAVWVWPREAVAGLATGLLLLVAAQFFIDHVSERRARSYLASLHQHSLLSIIPP